MESGDGDARGSCVGSDAMDVDSGLLGVVGVAEDVAEATIDADVASQDEDASDQRHPLPQTQATVTEVQQYAAADADVEAMEIFVIILLFIMLGAVLGSMDWRSLRAPPGEKITCRSTLFVHFWSRCTTRSMAFPEKSAQYAFDFGLAVLLTYYGNGCGQDGDGIGGAAAQLGMSRPVASRYIAKLEELLFEMKDDVIYFPPSDASDEWSEFADGLAARNADFPDVACIFDGTLVRTQRPKDFQGFYDKSGKPSYNCLAAIDYRYKFRYLGVFSGSNSDQSMWNQSAVLGAHARELCPPGINWLSDAGFKPWPFLMVPFDERGGKRLTAKQRCYNYHLSQTRILVERVFGKLKTRFKTLHGVTDRKKYNTNARMITAAAALHNLLIDIGDKQFKVKRNAAQKAKDRQDSRRVMHAFNEGWDRTQAEIDLALAKRNAYADRFYENDHE
ncbi:DDE superfamily endonuclease [Phytophthora infestans]|uniref:DDE superfamily endonuclease n=1 Tax=Phytophthora infestans TaxID=4787 RepID=A0A8S9V643_PHYIN|nr:DDE superfamily endonuclease [Phytophthora infestans]